MPVKIQMTYLISYAYDKAGNRIKKTDTKGATIYHFNRKNQLITEENLAGRNEFTYDRQGGIVEERNPMGTRRFSYNSRHQQYDNLTEQYYLRARMRFYPRDGGD